MDVKQAVQVAKDQIIILFGEEEIMNVGLEEVELDDEGHWRITIGFSRPWDRNVGSVLSGGNSRSYKMIVIRDEDGRFLSVKDWTISKAL